MKNLSIILVVIITISCSYVNQSQARNYNGKYKSDDPNACPIEIKITKNAYVFKLNDKIQKGKLEIKVKNQQVYFTFIGLKGSDPKIDIEGQLMDGAIFIQNTGNAMNPFTRFSECDVKYIQLIKNE